MRRRIVHLLVCLPAAAAAVGLVASGASALVVHLPGGRAAGLQLRPGVNPAAVSGSGLGSVGPALAGPALADNGTLNYDGGPVLHATRPYLVFWDPTGTGVAATSRSVLEQYLTDVAADRGESDDTYGVARQYYDSSGFAGASASFTAAAQAISDTQPYPALDSTSCNVPSGYTNCVTDTQVQAELTRLIAAGGLPTGVGSPAPVYFVVTPPTTDVCVDAQDCADAGSSGAFCAYHSNFLDAHNQVVYAALPFAALKANPKDCQGDNPANTAVQEPNGDVADVVADNLSHENLESITDPLPQTPAWIDNNTQNEVADNCQAYGPVANETNSGGPVNPNAYSPTLGGSAAPVAPATYGTLFDQSINGDRYYTQTVWSNGDINCEAQPSAAGLTPAFTAPTTVVAPGTSVTLNPTASTSTAGVSSTTWSFGDGASSFSPGGPGSTSHTFAVPGSYTVALTLVDTRGNLATTTRTVTVAASAAPPVTVPVTPPMTTPVAPTAAFSISPAPGLSGSPITLDGSGSSDPNSGASVTAYAWSFDDGATATGARVNHTFAAPGQHSITLTITDSLGLSSQATHTILVVAPGRITGIAVRKVKGTEYVVVTVSQGGLVRFASKTVTLTGPGSTRFKLTLTKAQRRRLAHHRSVRELLAVAYMPLYGPAVQQSRSVTIQP